MAWLCEVGFSSLTYGRSDSSFVLKLCPFLHNFCPMCSKTRKSSYFGDISDDAYVSSIANLTRLAYLAQYVLGSFQNSTNSNLEEASHLFFRQEGGCSPNTLFSSRIVLLILYQHELTIIAMENPTG